MRTWLLIAATAIGGCASAPAPDPGLEGLSLEKVAPGTVVPGTKLVLKGASFVDAEWGTASLRLVGKAGGGSVDLAWPATFVDFNTLTVSVDAGMIDTLGGDVDFAGDAFVEIVATSDGNTYSTDKISSQLSFRKKLIPNVTGIVGGVI